MHQSTTTHLCSWRSTPSKAKRTSAARFSSTRSVPKTGATPDSHADLHGPVARENEMLIPVHGVLVQRSVPRNNTVRSDNMFQDRPPKIISMNRCSNLGPLNCYNGEIRTPTQQPTTDQNEKHNLGVCIVFGCSGTRSPSSFPGSWMWVWKRSMHLLRRLLFRSIKRKKTFAKQRVNSTLPTRRTLCTAHSVDLCTIIGTTRRMRSVLFQ